MSLSDTSQYRNFNKVRRKVIAWGSPEDEELCFSYPVCSAFSIIACDTTS